jgi:hypothetical protein
MLTGTDILVGNMRFCDLRSDQRTNAVKNSVRASQTRVRAKSRLAARREVKVAVEPPKAFECCLCTSRIVDGKRFTVSQPDCPNPSHGTFKENLRFERKAQNAEVGRQTRARAKSY